MKKGSKKHHRGQDLYGRLATDFVRGFVASGLLSLFQDRHAHPGMPPDLQRALRHAVQGGAALAAGSLVAESVARGNYAIALGAASGGAAAVIGAENLLRPVGHAALPEYSEV